MNLDNSRFLITHGSMDLRDKGNIMFKCPENIKIYFFENPSNTLSQFKSGIIINWLMYHLKRGIPVDKFNDNLLNLLIDGHTFTLHKYEGGDLVPDLSLTTQDPRVQCGLFKLRQGKEYFSGKIKTLNYDSNIIKTFLKNYIKIISDFENPKKKPNQKQFISNVENAFKFFLEKNNNNILFRFAMEEDTKAFYSNELNTLLKKKSLTNDKWNRYYEHTNPDHNLQDYIKLLSKQNKGKQVTIYTIACRNFKKIIKPQEINTIDNFLKNECPFDDKNNVRKSIETLMNIYDTSIQKINNIQINERIHEKKNMFIIEPIQYFRFTPKFRKSNSNQFTNEEKTYVRNMEKIFRKNYEILFGKVFPKNITYNGKPVNIYKLIIENIDPLVKGIITGNVPNQSEISVISQQHLKDLVIPLEHFLKFHLFNIVNCMFYLNYMNPGTYKLKQRFLIGTHSGGARKSKRKYKKKSKKQSKRKSKK